MTNDNPFKAIIDSLPPKPARSRLEPYSKLILALHRRRRTYREIARVLSDRCNVQTSRSTVNDFVRAHLKMVRNSRKAAQPKVRRHQNDVLVQRGKPVETIVVTDELNKRIANLKCQPLSIETVRQIFRYDPDKPLSLLPKKKA